MNITYSPILQKERIFGENRMNHLFKVKKKWILTHICILMKDGKIDRYTDMCVYIHTHTHIYIYIYIYIGTIGSR